MLLAQDFRRQAYVCARLADDCDPRLARRLGAMASDLLAKAEDLKEDQACSASSGSNKGRIERKSSSTEAVKGTLTNPRYLSTRDGGGTLSQR